MKRSLPVIFHWTPRFLSIIVALIVSAFALDAIEVNVSALENMQNIFIHLIPGLIITVLAIIAWRHALVGGGLFILLAIIYAFVAHDHLQWVLVISLPLFVLGALFVLSFIKLHKWYE